VCCVFVGLHFLKVVRILFLNILQAYYSGSESFLPMHLFFTMQNSPISRIVLLKRRIRNDMGRYAVKHRIKMCHVSCLCYALYKI